MGILGNLDVDTKIFGIEVKAREKLPTTIKKWWAQAVTNSGVRVPLVHLHEHGKSHSEDLCIIKADDLKAIVDAYL